MQKWIAIAFLVLILGFLTVAYLCGVSLRNAAIIEGKMHLKMAANEYAEQDYVTNYGAKSYQVWLSTNFVNIGGTQYQCFIITTNVNFYDEGSLAMTTNQTFIWLDSKRPPKIIGTNYRAPIFPPQF